MKKTHYLVDFPIFSHTHSIEKATDFITTEVLVEGDHEWKTQDLEKAVAKIADPSLYQLSEGLGYGTGIVKSWLPLKEPALSSTHPDFPGVFVGSVYRTTKK